MIIFMTEVHIFNDIKSTKDKVIPVGKHVFVGWEKLKKVFINSYLVRNTSIWYHRLQIYLQYQMINHILKIIMFYAYILYLHYTR